MPKLFQLLGTKKVREQEERVGRLIEQVQAKRFAVTIFVDGDNVRFDVVGGSRVTTQDVKEACYGVVEQVAQLELENRMAQNEQPDNDRPDVDDSNDSSGPADSAGDIQE